MSKTNGSDPFKRHKTRHRGVTYRERADGTRTRSQPVSADRLGLLY